MIDLPYFIKPCPKCGIVMHHDRCTVNIERDINGRIISEKLKEITLVCPNEACKHVLVCKVEDIQNESF